MVRFCPHSAPRITRNTFFRYGGPGYPIVALQSSVSVKAVLGAPGTLRRSPRDRGCTVTRFSNPRSCSDWVRGQARNTDTRTDRVRAALRFQSASRWRTRRSPLEDFRKTASSFCYAELSITDVTGYSTAARREPMPVPPSTA